MDQLCFFFFADDGSTYKCVRPKKEEKNLVTGKVKSSSYCSVERGEYLYLDVCGPGAKYFEPK